MIGFTVFVCVMGLSFDHPVLYWILLGLPLLGIGIFAYTGYLYRLDGTAETDRMAGR